MIHRLRLFWRGSRWASTDGTTTDPQNEETPVFPNLPVKMHDPQFLSLTQEGRPNSSSREEPESAHWNSVHCQVEVQARFRKEEDNTKNCSDHDRKKTESRGRESIRTDTKSPNTSPATYRPHRPSTQTCVKSELHHKAGSHCGALLWTARLRYSLVHRRRREFTLPAFFFSDASEICHGPTTWL